MAGWPLTRRLSVALACCVHRNRNLTLNLGHHHDDDAAAAVYDGHATTATTDATATTGGATKHARQWAGWRNATGRWHGSDAQLVWILSTK